MRRKSKKSGFTLMEMMTAAVISTMILFAAITMFISGATAWMKGSEAIETETQSKQAIRMISNELREAMLVTIDGNKLGVTYRLPQRQSDGTFVAPAVWDGVTRRIYLSNGKIYLQDNGGSRVICRNVILTDPKNSNASYVLFTAGAGATLRDLTVKIITQRVIPRGPTLYSRKREVVFLRNVPSIVS